MAIAFIPRGQPGCSREGEENTMITAKIQLTNPFQAQRQFIAETGSGHHLILDDAAGGTGAKPIELVAVALAGCTAFDVITMLRQKHHQKVTGYAVVIEADQAERPPQVFTMVRIRHVVTGMSIDGEALAQAIHLSEEKYCSVGAMIAKSAKFETHYEIHEESAMWLRPGALSEQPVS
jgi:putative redox protein